MTQSPENDAPKFLDELDAHIAESMKDPEYAAAFRAAEERQARLLERPCREGNCVELYDPETGESDSGWGPVGCPCQDENPAAHSVIPPVEGVKL
jgi:hypothetical protein